MSYPRKLHILAIEDDSDAIEALKVSFGVLKNSVSLVDPVFARSFADARRHIEGSGIFHVVLLDLNLPWNTKESADDGLAPGEQLLEALAKRDGYPIPVVLVISGKLGIAQSIGGMQDRLGEDFWYGRLVNKGPAQHREIEVGLAHAIRYVDVGIHLRDAGKEWYPTLSPREEDLLRRCVLLQESSIGVDLRWWGAEDGPSISRPSPNDGPTKVLMGHFLLDQGFGNSVPTFFKFEPAGNARFVFRDTGIMAQKLGHVKVYHAGRSRQRSIIVTQSVTSTTWPVPLNELLRDSTDQVEQAVSSIMEDIVEQLKQLGEHSEDQVSVGDFLWEHLDRAVIARTWDDCDRRQWRESDIEDPLQAFDSLKASSVKLWATRRSCTHGDLNATNVAIDTRAPGSFRAYIFDAAGMKADFELRDLATLEITTVLFNSVALHSQLVDACRGFYESEFLPTELTVSSAFSNLSRNVPHLISAIRSRFKTEQERRVYAVLVFDAALRQLFGIGVQPSPNKIKNPLHACMVASWVARWLKKVAPDLFTTAAKPGVTV